MRHIYLDESTFSEPNKYVGYGALLTDQPVKNEIINEALKNLYNDPDRFDPKCKDMDDRTLKKGYFHASEDSKNARSHLCTAIRDNVKGSFKSNYFDYIADKSDEKKKIFALTSMLNSLEIFCSHEPIKIVFENRKGLNKAILDQWYNEAELEVLKTIYDKPFFPTFFPKHYSEIDDKSNPGLQIADFILWTINKKVNNNPTWYNRLKPLMSMEKSLNSTPDGWGFCELIFKKETKISEVFYEIDDFPVDPDKRVDDTKVIQFYCNAEKVISQYSKEKLPTHLSHFQNELIAISKHTFNIDRRERIKEVALIYLKLFDSLPIIKRFTLKRDKEFLLLSKKYLALVLRDDLVNGVMTRDFLSRARNEILRKEPALLKLN